MSNCQQTGRLCSPVNHLANFAELKLTKAKQRGPCQIIGPHLIAWLQHQESGFKEAQNTSAVPQVLQHPHCGEILLSLIAGLSSQGRHMSNPACLGFRAREKFPCCLGRRWPRGLNCALPLCQGCGQVHLLLEKQLYMGKGGEDERMLSGSRGHATEIQRANIISNVQAPFQEQLHAQSGVHLTPVICWLAPKISPLFSRHCPQTLGVVTQMQDRGLLMVLQK